MIQCATAIVFADDQDANDPDSDRKLTVFCQSGLLESRGVAVTPFARTSDFRICEGLKQIPAIQTALGVTDADLARAASIRATRRQTVESKEFTPAYQLPDEYSEQLQSVIPDKNRKVLLYLYLRLEGLEALCRPEFVEILGLTPATHRSISVMAQKAYEKAQPKYHGLFMDGAVEELDRVEITLELRQTSVELNKQILNILTRTERIKLLKLVRESLELSPEIVVYQGF